MSDITNAAPAKTRSLQLLGIYVALALLSALVRVIGGTGSPVAVLAYVVITALIVYAARSARPVAGSLGDWLPLLALPILYGAVPWSIVYQDARVFDTTVQGWDRSVFGTDPARTMAGAMPWQAVSELLHLAYFSYYAIIYGPALVFYLRVRPRRAFHEIVLAFTMAMVAAFVAFSVFPVAGPRYEWPAPEGVPGGAVRGLVLSVLQAGSSRGTAFPSSHVAIALSIALMVLRWRRVAGIVLTVTTVLLGIGAIYGGFHYAADVLAGVALGVGCWGITTRISGRSFEAPAERGE